jgi:transposase-like protein
MQTQRLQRRYSDEERANALAALAANGGNFAKTARDLGIPRRTLQDWHKGTIHPEAAENSAPKKTALTEQFENLAYQMLEIAFAKAAELDAKAATVAAATAVDKMLLLRGKPTSIYDTPISDEERNQRLAALLERWRARQMNPPPNGGAVAPL